MHAIGRFGIGFFSIFMLGPIVRVYSRRCDRGQETGRLLEFRGGTSARPILSPAEGDGVPIDGGTRVEVKLKADPYQNGGLLSAGPYSKKPIALSLLVGSVAPNLDVLLTAVENDEAKEVARPGDWLDMKDGELIRRLNPVGDFLDADNEKDHRALMRPVDDTHGAIYGRAFISPSRYSFSYPSDGGWVTIAGLRASRLSNVQGILLGEAITAARDAAQPIVSKEVLAEWASKQADLISKTVQDEERQARSAEVVLECGGNIGALKIVKWGSDWLNAEEFDVKLRSVEELAISFDGEFDYDEDQDDVHPREFRAGFTPNADIAIVLKHDGSILRSNNFSWPNSLTGQTKWSDSSVAAWVRGVIHSVWPDPYEHDTERAVGRVYSTEIMRDVTVYRPAAANPVDPDGDLPF